VLSEIHPQTGTEVDPRFKYPAADALHAGEVPLLDPGHRGEDARRRRIIEAVPRPYLPARCNLPYGAGGVIERKARQSINVS
jgi:hypothetical protein